MVGRGQLTVGDCPRTVDVVGEDEHDPGFMYTWVNLLFGTTRNTLAWIVGTACENMSLLCNVSTVDALRTRMDQAKSLYAWEQCAQKLDQYCKKPNLRLQKTKFLSFC